MLNPGMEIDVGAGDIMGMIRVNTRMVKIAPSILDSDLARLSETLGSLEAAGADYVHLDVMDGHFVPNISIGIPVVRSVRQATALPLDVHLMIDQPERYVRDFVEAGADILTVHVEATIHPHRVLQTIRETGCKAGIALNPGTSIASIRDLLPVSDLVLLMSVNPGFGGQSFIRSTIRRIFDLRRLLEEEGLNAEIEIDGGVDAAIAAEVVAAGATILVAGSAVFKHPDGVEVAISRIREAIRN
jgi:ribulose-phosphate 3-epimerase